MSRRKQLYKGAKEKRECAARLSFMRGSGSREQYRRVKADDYMLVDGMHEMKIAYLIQSVRTEYWENHSKGFRHIQSDRKPLLFYEP